MFEIGSEVNCGIMAWAVTKPRSDGCSRPDQKSIVRIMAWAVTKSKYDRCSRRDQKSIVVKQPGRCPNRDKMIANNIHSRVACNGKMLKKHWMKKATR